MPLTLSLCFLETTAPFPPRELSCILMGLLVRNMEWRPPLFHCCPKSSLCLFLLWAHVPAFVPACFIKMQLGSLLQRIELRFNKERGDPNLIRAPLWLLECSPHSPSHTLFHTQTHMVLSAEIYSYSTEKPYSAAAFFLYYTHCRSCAETHSSVVKCSQ